MIEIIDVSKNFGNISAVRNINLKIKKNTLFGLIGPDGAGKTTLFRLITTLLVPDSGVITVLSMDTVKQFREIRKHTGYMPGRFSLYPDLTVQENLTFYATIFGTTIQENYHLIKPVYSFLEPFSDRLAKNLSGGMKQKLALCCALIHNPQLLVLDEPTTGVDAVSRKEFWETLHILKNSGMTILVSTPYMDEAEKCDRVALMQHGTLLLADSPGNILSAYQTPLFEINTDDRLGTLHILRSIQEIKRAYLFGQSIHIAMQKHEFDDQWLTERLTSQGLSEIVIHPVKPDFEDCFIDAVEKNKERA